MKMEIKVSKCSFYKQNFQNRGYNCLWPTPHQHKRKQVDRYVRSVASYSQNYLVRDAYALVQTTFVRTTHR